MSPTRCPCGSGDTYATCCQRLHLGDAQAPSAEALMRSRFSAFAVGDADYLLRTWHPSTRPPSLELDPAQRWLSLEVLHAHGGLFDTEGRVEFRAHYRDLRGRGSMHERSTFTRNDGAWVYVDAVRE